MKRWVCGALTGLLLALGAGAAAPETETRGTVVIGAVTCFRIRVPDRGQRIPELVAEQRDELVLTPVLLAQGVLHPPPVRDVGPVEEDPRAHAERMFIEAGLHTRPAVLVLVAPQARRVEIVTAPEARERVSDEAAHEAVELMTKRFADGHLVSGLIAGVEHIAAAAGPGQESGEELPDLLQG